MGWMETCAVDERMRFVMAVEEQDKRRRLQWPVGASA